MGVWDEISELKEQVAELADRLNDTIRTMNRNTANDEEYYNELNHDIIRIKKQNEWAEKSIERLRGVTRSLHRRNRFHLEDIFELQEALVAYLNKHPTKYKDIREMVKSTIKLVEARLKRRPQILKMIEKALETELEKDVLAMKKLTVYELDWACLQVENRYRDVKDSNPKLAEKLSVLMRYLSQVIIVDY